MKDPTLERIWAAREAIAKRAGYDPKILLKQLREREMRRKKDVRSGSSLKLPAPTVGKHDAMGLN